MSCTDPATKQLYLDVRYTLAIGHAANPGVMIATATKDAVGRSVLDDTTGATHGPGILTGRGGASIDRITVHRSTAGAAQFSFTIHCANAGGVECRTPSPTWTLITNN